MKPLPRVIVLPSAIALAVASLLTACGGGGGGGGGSNGSSITVIAPSILTQPAAAEAQRCESVTFSVAASGTGPLTYQWQRNDQDISGANKPSLQVNPGTADDGARYSVTVSNSAGQVKSTAATLKVNAVDESKLSIASVELAQVMLMDSKDTALELVQDREVLVKVNARAPAPMHCKPTGLLRVEDAAGQPLRELTLAAPLLPIPASAPEAASLLDSYSATVPADLVKPGVRLVVALQGQPAQRIAPMVSPSPAITLVAIPMQVGDSVAQIPAGIPDYVRARSPVQSLTQDTRGVLRSTAQTTQPKAKEEWNDALSKLLTEVNNMRALEGRPARTYYYGFVRQDVIGSTVGLGYRPGNAAVGYDRPEFLESALDTLQHELGHNFNLQHAPCGEPATPDPLYPYANAQMGAGNRMVWGYNSVSKLFTDPRDLSNHDLMSYCTGAWFSDYNYGRIQQRLRTALPSAQAAIKGVQIASAAAAEPESLLLISGEIGPRGTSLSAPRAYSGQADLPASGPYTLTLNLATGEQRQWRFDAQVLEHLPQTRHFQFSIPHPGAILSVSISRDAQVLIAQGDAGEAGKRRAQQAVAPQVLAGVSKGQLSLQWNSERWPQLSITQVSSSGKRRVLGQALAGGKAAVESNGEVQSYELSFSDGLNSQLLWLDAEGRSSRRSSSWPAAL